jgi:hypothetical protein
MDILMTYASLDYREESFLPFPWVLCWFSALAVEARSERESISSPRERESEMRCEMCDGFGKNVCIRWDKI